MIKIAKQAQLEALEKFAGINDIAKRLMLASAMTFLPAKGGAAILDGVGKAKASVARSIADINVGRTSQLFNNGIPVNTQ